MLQSIFGVILGFNYQRQLKGTLWPSPSVFLFLESPTMLRAKTMSVNSCVLTRRKPCSSLKPQQRVRYVSTTLKAD